MSENIRPSNGAPLLVTERLQLRAHRPDDLDACAVLWADPVVTRYIGGKPFTREEVWSKLLRYAGLWSWLDFGYWAIVEKVSGRLVGELGFADFKRAITPAIDGIPEIGWILSPEVHGRGYATEALRAVLAWGDARFEAGPSACLIDPGNRPSIRVAEKSGFQENRRVTYKGQPTILFLRDPRKGNFDTSPLTETD
jgi:RimJ/RimL family protein N-acetyltransferase